MNIYFFRFFIKVCIFLLFILCFLSHISYEPFSISMIIFFSVVLCAKTIKIIFIQTIAPSYSHFISPWLWWYYCVCFTKYQVIVLGTSGTPVHFAPLTITAWKWNNPGAYVKMPRALVDNRMVLCAIEGSHSPFCSETKEVSTSLSH